MLNIIQTILLVLIAWFIVAGRSRADLKSVFAGRNRKIVLDSCSLIDGRIVEIISSRFVTGELVIPQFILNELQMLADGGDSHKRERARFGLDIAHQLQDTSPIPVSIDRTVFEAINATDDKLVALSKKLQAQLYTTDYNLAKVAAIEGVSVLNVNELAQNLRPIALPGETLTIKIVQKGSNHGQGVGYLDDGTMIVVENAQRLVGKHVPVTVTRMHQTVAGKMVFGHAQAGHEERSAATRTSAAVPAPAPARPAPQPQRPQQNPGQSSRRRPTASHSSQPAGTSGAARLRSRLSNKLR